ncbi:unnamed protein product [Periconia digitata]|uniref:C2H2-type domain-containing protein n=1 Tax=Periconia digitata TaxID=1303443 RepID=A0A9W4U3C4_9PLEO|nr:unnamed protein product [Periconia digitata]
MSSDSEMTEDLEFGQADPESYFEEVAIQCLFQNPELRFLNLEDPEALQGLRSCVAKALSSKRRHSAPLEGTPPKRRSGTNRKRSGQDNDNNDDEDGEGSPNERRAMVSGTGSRSVSYACPYLKYNPNGISERHRCDAGWPDIPRLKGHLFRCHKIFLCVRCWEAFSRELDLTTHLRTESSCNVVDPPPDDAYDWGRGFNNEQETKLKSRDKNVAETTKWKNIYKILFPRVANEDIPSPYNISHGHLPPFPSPDSARAGPSSQNRDEEIITRVVERLIRCGQQQQHNIGGYTGHVGAYGDQGFRQLPTPQNTLTSRESGHMPYTGPFHMNQIAPNNFYLNPHSHGFGTTSDLTNDSAYSTSHSSTNQPAYPQYGYRPQEHLADQSLDDRPVLSGAGLLCGMENYELGNDYQLPPGSMD